MRFSGFIIALAGIIIGSIPIPSHTHAPHRLGDETKTHPTVAFIGVNVIPMDRERIRREQTVIVKDGVIISVGPSRSAKIPDDALSIDGRGQYLIPGLTDAHVHIRDRGELASYLAYGVTTVFQMRGSPEILKLREEIADGKMLGPTIYTTGPLVDGDPPIYRGSNTVVVTNTQEAKRTVAEQKRAGYDFIKVYNRLDPDSYEAIIIAAILNNIAVVGHIPRKVGAERAIKNQQAMIAHGEEFFFTYFGGPADKVNQAENRAKPDESKIPALAQAVAKAGIAVTPNLSFIAATKMQIENIDSVLTDPETKYLHPDVLSMWKSNNSTKRRDLEQFTEREKIKYPLVKALTEGFSNAGVMLLLGTDASAPGLFPGRSAHLELRELVNAGLTPYEALSTGTRNAGRFIAKHLAYSKRFGTIEVGQRADMILLRENPLKNIEALS
ncbi:MAG: amidohydrolase family protein, partial [Acidobacteriota bacterium]